MEKIVNGIGIEVNEEGFMTNFNQWNESIGQALAIENEIQKLKNNIDEKNHEITNHIDSIWNI